MPKSMVMQGSVLGAVIGGLLRGLLTFFNLGGQAALWLLLLCLPSVALGALCGGLAGASRTPLRGVFWGGLLAGVSFAVFVIPLAYLFSFLHLAGEVERFSLPYLLERVVAGGLAGGIGAALGLRSRTA